MTNPFTLTTYRRGDRGDEDPIGDVHVEVRLVLRFAWVPPRALWSQPRALFAWVQEKRAYRAVHRLEASLRGWARRQQVAQHRRTTMAPTERIADSLPYALKIRTIEPGGEWPGAAEVPRSGAE